MSLYLKYLYLRVNVKIPDGTLFCVLRTNNQAVHSPTVWLAELQYARKMGEADVRV